MNDDQAIHGTCRRAFLRPAGWYSLPMKTLKTTLLGMLLPLMALTLSSTVLAAPPLPPLNSQPSGLSLPGKFTWFDLATPEIEAQKSFYASLFGWSFRSPGSSEDGYTLVLNRGQVIGGMFQFEPPSGEQDGAAWIALMSSTDPEQTLQRVKSAGGRVEGEPASVPQRGRHALFRDPEGALFGVLRSDSGDPPDAEVEIGGFLWLDLFTQDVTAMAAFYSGLAPYETEQREIAQGIERTILSAHGMPRASIVPVDEEANRSAWVPYVRVADVAATLEKVVEGGGFAIVPPDEQVLGGNLAVFVDPHGGVTGIVKWDYEEEAAP